LLAVLLALRLPVFAFDPDFAGTFLLAVVLALE
jgi:hypothetical protein